MIFNEELRELFNDAKLTTHLNRACVVLHTKWNTAEILEDHLRRLHRDEIGAGKECVTMWHRNLRLMVIFRSEFDAMEFYLSIST